MPGLLPGIFMSEIRTFHGLKVWRSGHEDETRL
jgi:hypothetical protein